MPDLILWKNQEINKLKKNMDRLLCSLRDDFCVPILPGTAAAIPLMDLSESDEYIIIKAEVPGINPEDLEISVAENVLTISGEIKQADNQARNGYRWERRSGFFSRTLQLPCKIVMDDVKATYEEGILSIVMPKCKPDEARIIKIDVR